MSYLIDIFISCSQHYLKSTLSRRPQLELAIPKLLDDDADAHQSSPCPGQARAPWPCPRAWRSWSSLRLFPTSRALGLEDASSHQYVAARSSPLFYTGHTSLRAWRTRRRSCVTTWCGPWAPRHIWIAFCTVNSCSPCPGQPQPGVFSLGPSYPIIYFVLRCLWFTLRTSYSAGFPCHPKFVNLLWWLRWKAVLKISWQGSVGSEGFWLSFTLYWWVSSTYSLKGRPFIKLYKFGICVPWQS